LAPLEAVLAVRRSAPGAEGTLIDVLDRVLDKGIVVDAWGRMSVAGIDLVGMEMHVVVASIDTYLRYADVLGLGARHEVIPPPS
jgi:gas vesicle structural protein